MSGSHPQNVISLLLPVDPTVSCIRYGLYDPRQADGGKASAGGMGLESTAAPRLVAGIGDKGAGWVVIVMLQSNLIRV